MLLGSESDELVRLHARSLTLLYKKDYALSFYGRVALSKDMMRNNEHRNEHQKGNVIVRSFAM